MSSTSAGPADSPMTAADVSRGHIKGRRAARREEFARAERMWRQIITPTTEAHRVV